LPELIFQVIRRTIASPSQTKGRMKAPEGMVRHDRLATTGNVYVQVNPEEVEGKVSSVYGELRKPNTAAAETPAITSNPRAKSSGVPNAKLQDWRQIIRYPGSISETNQLNLNWILVDLVGIEPTTSSMT
jgi:hypothetical protein